MRRTARAEVQKAQVADEAELGSPSTANAQDMVRLLREMRQGLRLYGVEGFRLGFRI